MTKNDFLKLISKLVVEENNKRGNKLFSSVVIAQAICESGWGQSSLMMKANAVFGIKATSDWKGKVYNAKTQEVINGKYISTYSYFRAYISLADSVSDYFNLILGLSRYKKAINCKTPLECITAIKNGGYATSLVYVDTIMRIIKDNNLTQYDTNQKIKETYKIGNVYTLQVDLNVRYGAGTNNEIKQRNELTVDGKKHARKTKRAILKTGTRVTCLDIINLDDEIWFKIPSGFVCANYKGKVYIK